MNVDTTKVEVTFGSERAAELAQTLDDTFIQVSGDYLKRWEEGEVEPQELVDRMDGFIMAAEANLRASILMAASALGLDPMMLFAISGDRLSKALLVQVTMMEQERVVN